MKFEKRDNKSALAVGLLCGLAFWVFGIPGLAIVLTLLLFTSM